jgi:hypothetical protein
VLVALSKSSFASASLPMFFSCQSVLFLSSQKIFSLSHQASPKELLDIKKTYYGTFNLS